MPFSIFIRDKLSPQRQVVYQVSADQQSCSLPFLCSLSSDWFPAPYVLNHLTGEAIQFYNVVWRVLVSNEISAGAMTYFGFNGGYASTALPVHYHPGVSETFYGKSLLHVK